MKFEIVILLLIAFIGGSLSISTKKCPAISANMIKEKQLLNESLSRVLGELRASTSFDAPYFFQNFFMQAFEYSYHVDVANLIAFQSIFTAQDPPPSTNPFGIIFSIFTSLISLLPDGGPIATSLTLVNDGIQLATDSSGKNQVQTVSWEEFIANRALSYPDAQEGIKNGLWNYIQGYWKTNKLPKKVTSKDWGSLHKLEALVNVSWYQQETQTQAFLKLVADYINHAHSGIVTLGSTAHYGQYVWRISLIHNNDLLTKKLLEITNNCLDPRTNFKDSNGTSIKELQATLFSEPHLPAYCRQMYVDNDEFILSLDQPSLDKFLVCKEYASAVKF